MRKQIIMFLANKASDDGSGIYCSKGTIARHTELGASTVKRVISEFVTEGILVETGSRACTNGFTVIYRIDIDTVEMLELARDVTNSTPPRVNRVHSRPGTGSGADPVPRPQRTPNNPKTILKPPTREREVEDEIEDDVFEVVLASYPHDRVRDRNTCLYEIATAINAGVLPDNLLHTVNAYAEETKGYTRSKVCFSDNWFKARRWEKGLVEFEASRVRAQEAESKGLANLAAWIIDRHPLCCHITERQLKALLAANLVTEIQVKEAGLRL